MKILIDTNVLVSAALKDRDPEAVILWVVEQPEVQWIVSPEILQEYKEVLSRPKFKLPEEIRQRWFTALDECTVIVEVEDELVFPRDHKDAKFLTCAIAAETAYFITGDRDFSEAKKLVSTTILSVAMFKQLVCEKLA